LLAAAVEEVVAPPSIKCNRRRRWWIGGGGVGVREAGDAVRAAGLLHHRVQSARAMVDWQRWRRLTKLLLRRLYRRYAEGVGVGVGDAGEAGEAVRLFHRRM
jgi:hypothetical protein